MKKSIQLLCAAFALIATAACIFGQWDAAAMAGTTTAYFFSPIFSTKRMQDVKKWAMDQYKTPIGNGKFDMPVTIDAALRIEQTLTTGKNQYKFDVINGTTTWNDVEMRLDQNDVFITTHLGLYIYEQDIAEIGREILQTWPNTGGFANVTAANVRDLELVYNGNLELKVGITTYVSQLSTQVFRQVPGAQKGTVTAVNGTTDKTLENSEYGAMMGRWELSSPIILSGQASNSIALNIPNFSGAVLTHNSASFKNQVAFFPIGFLLKNAAVRSKARA